MHNILFWLLRQSVLALIVGGLAHLLERRIRNRPKVFFWVWSLVLLCFVWPDSWSLWRLTELSPGDPAQTFPEWTAEAAR